MKKYRESIMKVVFLVAACVSILAVVLICGFLFVNGFPAIAEIGPLKFLTGVIWKPQEGEFGILPMIIGSIYATGIAILVGVPIGLLCSVFMARFCPQKLYKILKPAISLLAGIPSIVYGFFGLVVIVPIMQSIFGVGKSVLTAGILLGIMILPTIMRTTEEALRSIPQSYREASFGLGAGRLRTVFVILLPTALPGILGGVLLSVGRIVGETAALIYTAGTVAKIAGLTDGGRTLAVHMYALIGEGLYTDAAYATAVVLLAVVILLNALSDLLLGKHKKGDSQ